MFRLAKVLSWKEGLERLARVERLEVERRAEELQRAITGLEDTRKHFPDGGPGPDGADDLALWSGFGEGLRRKEQMVRRRLAALEPLLEEKRRAHVELSREVKGLERLEERDAAREKKRRERKAQEAIDDVAGRRNLPGAGREFPGGAAPERGALGTEPPGTRIPRDPGPNRETGT
ncbi:MAG: flagellar export protein FliJ [Candidatus Eiseniibacteriota bacterium]